VDLFGFQINWYKVADLIVYLISKAFICNWSQEQ